MPELNKSQDARQAADDAARRSADAMQQGGRAASEAVRRSAEASADVTREGTKASTEAMRRVGEAARETLQRSTQAVAEGQRKIAQDAAQRFEEVSRTIAEAARGTSEDVNRLFTLPNAAEGGLRDMQQGVAGLVEGVVQTNIRATQELFRLSNPAAVIELQQRFAREYVDTLMQGTFTLVQAIRRTADETLRPLEAQVAQRKQDQRFQQAAAE